MLLSVTTNLDELKNVLKIFLVPASQEAVGNVYAQVTSSRFITFKISLAFLMTLSTQLLMVIKHPGIHYMLPSLLLSLYVISWLMYRITLYKKSLLISIAIWLITLIGIGNACHNSLKTIKLLSDDRIRMNISSQEIEQVLHKFPDALIIGTYRCHLLECGLAFGGSYSPLSIYLSIPLKNFYYYNIWNDKLLIFQKGWEDPQFINKILLSGTKVFLISPDYPDYPVLKKFNLKLIISNPIQSLYEVNKVNPNDK